MGHENMGTDLRDRVAEILSDYRRPPHTTGNLTAADYSIADAVIALVRDTPPAPDAARTRAIVDAAREYAESRREWEEAIGPATEGEILAWGWVEIQERQDAARANLLALFAPQTQPACGADGGREDGG